MFRSEPLQNSVVNKLVSKGVSGFVHIVPLDDIPVSLPKSWKFKPTCMPESYVGSAEKFANFKVRADDVWIITFPKCGTTWTQEMTWMLMNNLNFFESNTVDITQRSLFFELNGVAPLESFDSFKSLEEQKSPRIIKSHLPISLLPRDLWKKKCKIIYVTRDPKDAMVSNFHQFVGMIDFGGSIEDFTEAFITDQVTFASYWNHVLEFSLIRKTENVLFLSFEDMKKDLRSVIKTTSQFLQKDIYNDDEIDRLIDHLSFEKMKASSTCNNQHLVKSFYKIIDKEYEEKTAFQFMRKGQVGSYKKELPKNCIDKINRKTNEVFLPHGLKLYTIEK